MTYLLIQKTRHTMRSLVKRKVPRANVTSLGIVSRIKLMSHDDRRVRRRWHTLERNPSTISVRLHNCDKLRLSPARV